MGLRRGWGPAAAAAGAARGALSPSTVPAPPPPPPPPFPTARRWAAAPPGPPALLPSPAAATRRPRLHFLSFVSSTAPPALINRPITAPSLPFPSRTSLPSPPPPPLPRPAGPAPLPPRHRSPPFLAPPRGSPGALRPPPVSCRAVRPGAARGAGCVSRSCRPPPRCAGVCGGVRGAARRRAGLELPLQGRLSSAMQQHRGGHGWGAPALAAVTGPQPPRTPRAAPGARRPRRSVSALPPPSRPRHPTSGPGSPRGFGLRSGAPGLPPSRRAAVSLAGTWPGCPTRGAPPREPPGPPQPGAWPGMEPEISWQRTALFPPFHGSVLLGGGSTKPDSFCDAEEETAHALCPNALLFVLYISFRFL